MVYIKDLQENQRIIGHYYCQEKTLCHGRTGKEYITLQLRDKTGIVAAKIWDITPLIPPFETGDFVKIDALVVAYKGEKQLNISQIRRSMEYEYDPAEYSPTTAKNMDQLHEELLRFCDEVKTPCLHRLLNAFFRDNPKMTDAIRVHPAAKMIHHSVIGGFMEHVVSVTRISTLLAGEYHPVNRDLVITAALLHDIGKLKELEPMPEAAYTTEGSLLGHIAMGFQMVHEQIARIPDFPQALGVELEHIILAHHGELEYGSPKVPMTMEAMIVHLADDADAKLKQVEEFIEKDTAPGEWTGRNSILARSFYKGKNT